MGKGPGRKRRSWGSSPRGPLRRRRAGRWRSTLGAELGVLQQWQPGWRADFRSGKSSNGSGRGSEASGRAEGGHGVRNRGGGGSGWTARTPAVARQRLSPARARAGRKRRGEKDRALERIRTRPRGSRGSPTADAWWSSPDCAGRGIGVCTGGAEEHCGVANEISLILTTQNSKFHIGTEIWPK